MNQQFATSANLTLAEGLGDEEAYTIYTTNTIANQYLDQSLNLSSLQTDAVTWTDPLDDIIAMANELGLRTAISLSDYDGDYTQPTDAQPYITYPNLTLVNRTISQDITASTTYSGNFYHTSKGWLVSGVAIMLLNCVLIMPTFWGWWRLERLFTMNPLETAKAFDAPALRDTDPFTSPTTWAETLKKMRVRYGKGQVDPEADVSLENISHRGKTMGGTEDIQEVLVLQEDGDGQSSRLSRRDDASRRSIPKFRKVE